MAEPLPTMLQVAKTFRNFLQLRLGYPSRFLDFVPPNHCYCYGLGAEGDLAPRPFDPIVLSHLTSDHFWFAQQSTLAITSRHTK
jgi:hypothetical protein